MVQRFQLMASDRHGRCSVVPKLFLSPTDEFQNDILYRRSSPFLLLKSICQRTSSLILKVCSLKTLCQKRKVQIFKCSLWVSVNVRCLVMNGSRLRFEVGGYKWFAAHVKLQIPSFSSYGSQWQTIIRTSWSDLPLASIIINIKKQFDPYLYSHGYK